MRDPDYLEICDQEGRCPDCGALVGDCRCGLVLLGHTICGQRPAGRDSEAAVLRSAMERAVDLLTTALGSRR